MKRGQMLVTERQRLIYGTSNYDVSWVVTRYGVNGIRRRYNYSAEAVRRLIELWKGPVRFRLKKEWA